MKIQRKYIIYFTSTIFCTLISGCAITYGKWTPYDGSKELPYAQGNIVEAKYRSRPCAMCVTGNNGEVAYFASKKCSNSSDFYNKKYNIKDIFSDAQTLLEKSIPKDKWIFTGKTFVKTDRYFYPIRVFIPSIDPMVLAIVPWDQYNLNKVKSDTGYIVDEAQKFYEFEKIDEKRSNRLKHIEIGWPSELHIPFELRRSLPFLPEQVRIVSYDFDKTIKIQSTTNTDSGIEFKNYKIKFIESNNKLDIIFENLNSNCKD